MAESISLDGRTLVVVANEGGDVDGTTRFHFQQDGDWIAARYAGGDIVDGYLVGALDGHRWDVRYVQLTADGDTATGHSIGNISLTTDGRVRVEDEWEWESRAGGGTSVLEEVDSD